MGGLRGLLERLSDLLLRRRVEAGTPAGRGGDPRDDDGGASVREPRRPPGPPAVPPGMPPATAAAQPPGPDTFLDLSGR